MTCAPVLNWLVFGFACFISGFASSALITHLIGRHKIEAEQQQFDDLLREFAEDGDSHGARFLPDPGELGHCWMIVALDSFLKLLLGNFGEEQCSLALALRETGILG